MKHQNVYDLSKRYGPPVVNLRDAEIADSCGNESHAKLSVTHTVPEDVTKEQFDYYGWVYPFVERTDLLFYLYPIAKEYESDTTLDCIDSFLYSLDREINGLLDELTTDEREALIEGLNWIWDVGSDDYADWEQCLNLQEAVGLK